MQIKYKCMYHISVIIPVYNAEKYINKCIECVQAQTYPYWQMILVDDGSKDNSLAICQQYANNDFRISVIHQENAGAGAARNMGIAHATGEYIVFIDSDDYVDKEYFSLLSKHDEDVVYIDVLRVTESGKVLKEEKMSKYKELSKDSFMRYQMTGAINWGGVRKCVKSSLLRDNNIQYCHFKNGEEALLTFQELVNANTYSFIEEKPVYSYVEHEMTLSSLPISDPWGEAVVAIKQYALHSCLYEQYANTINAFNVAATVVSIDRLSQQNKGKLLKKKIRERMAQFEESYNSNYSIDSAHLSIKARIFIPFLLRGITWPISLVSIIRKMI